MAKFQEFQEKRDPDFHAQITRALVSSVLLGHKEPWIHPEYQAFADGFNLHLDNKRLRDVGEMFLY
jgi:hypothetical protein